MAKITNLANQKTIHFVKYASIGRASRSTLSIKDRKLSRLHCEIIEVKGTFILIDLESHNGTKLNNENIFESPLTNGDTIEIGKSKVSFHLEDARE